MKKLCTLLLLLLQGFLLRATVHTVQVADFAFTPASVNAVCGDTILWIWVSGSHTTTSTAVPACANGWNAPINSSAGAFMYQVPCAGTYQYECSIHPSMTGTITVNCVTGIEETRLAVTGVYPNPFTGHLSVQSGNNDFIRVTDILGKEIHSEMVRSNTLLYLDLDVRPGIYFLQFYDGDRLTETRRLIRN